MIKTKLQKEAALKFVAWALEQLDVERSLYKEAKAKDALALVDEIEWGLKLICRVVGMSEIFEKVKNKL